MPRPRKPLRHGELERLVLETLWDSQTWMTPGEVHDVVVPDRRLAYTTIMTTLVRLWEKGRLERRRRGRAFEYHPVASRSEDAATRMQQALDAASDPRSALAQFVGAMTDGDRDELRRALRRGRRS